MSRRLLAMAALVLLTAHLGCATSPPPVPPAPPAPVATDPCPPGAEGLPTDPRCTPPPPDVIPCAEPAAMKKCLIAPDEADAPEAP